MKKYRKYLFFLTLLTTFIPKGSLLKMEALSARPINVTNTSVAAVRSYYSDLNSLSVAQRKGENLLANLKPILKNNHSTFNYATVWDWTKVTDRDWTLSPMTPSQLNSYDFSDNPYVKLLYRNDNGTATAPKHQDTHGRVIDREHVWPKSLGNFGEKAPAGTDLHHLILADSKNNQVGHNNDPYGNVNPSSYTAIDSYDNPDNPTNVGNYTGKRGDITFQGQTYTVYEPQDQDKGDIARAMFYMAARYSSYTSNTDPYLKLSNTPHTAPFTSNLSSPGQAGLLDTLLAWHTLDPVDDYEIKRNNLIYNNAQFNRNPFIDYPSWVDAVWGSGTATPASDYVTQYGQSGPVVPTALSVSPSTLSLNVGATSTFSVITTPGNADKQVTWTSSNTNVATINNSGIVTALSAGTTTITAKSVHNNIQGTATLTVSAVPLKTLTSISVTGYPATVKLSDPFNSGPLVVTATYSDSSTASVTSSATIETPDTNKLGTQTLGVSYTENGITKTTTYNVRITNNGVQIGNATTLATDLFFSEYIEGSSNNKYLEIYNGTGKSVNLSDYNLQLFANGSSNTTNNVQLSGTLANNSTIVYKNTSAALTLPNGVNATTNTAINFNGDDALALYKISTNAYVDIFGTIGTDPGTAWTGGGVSTVDKTLVRKENIYRGITTNPETFDPSVEWIQYPIDTASYLGSHTMNATTPGMSAETQANAWATSFLEKTEIYCEDLNGSALYGALWNELGEEYTYMDQTSKNLFKVAISDGDSDGISGAKARYYFLITKYQVLHNNNFMKDENNNPLYDVNSKKDSASNTNALLILSAIITTISVLYYFAIKRKQKLT